MTSEAYQYLMGWSPQAKLSFLRRFYLGDKDYYLIPQMVEELQQSYGLHTTEAMSFLYELNLEFNLDGGVTTH